MSPKPATPEALQAIIAKAEEKLSAARRDFEAGAFGDVSSRAYYAAFHAITAVLASRGLAFSSHAQTLGAFNREYIKSGIFPRDSFRIVQRLFEDRQVADYDWSRSIDLETARLDLEDAAGLVEACKRHLGMETTTL